MSTNLSLRGGVSYIDSKFTSYDDSQCFFPNPPALGGGDAITSCDATGNRLPKTPKLTFTLAPTLTLPTAVGEFSVTANYFHSSLYYADTQNFRAQKAYDIVNGRIGWTNQDGNFGVGLFAKNLLNKKYVSFVSLQGPGSVFSSSPPRTYGAELTFNF